MVERSLSMREVRGSMPLSSNVSFLFASCLFVFAFTFLKLSMEKGAVE